MSMQVAPRLVRKLPWAEAELVEGTEALLWPATSLDDAEAETPGSDDAFHAVLSWVRPQIIRFETATPEPLPELLLVSTLAVGGPAHFVVRKTYQISTTAACEPPSGVHIVERRDLFRVLVVAPVTLRSPEGTWDLHSVDCSLGGLRLCLPACLEVGAEVEVRLDLNRDIAVTLPAVVRHSHPYLHQEGRLKPGQPVPGRSPESPSVVGLQFLRVPGDTERKLSEFVGRHQRRLMPRVHTRIPMEYCPGERTYYLETFATEVCPGEIVYEARKAHLPGERAKVRLRLSRKDFEFEACVVACHSACREDGSPLHLVKVSLDEAAEAVEGGFRKVVRELAIERVSSRR